MLAIQTDGGVAPALLALGFLLLPGMAVSVALFGPGRLPLPTRLALLLPLGFAAVAAVSTFLALLHVLTLVALLLAYAVLVIGMVAVAAWRSRLAGQSPLLPTPHSPKGRMKIKGTEGKRPLAMTKRAAPTC